MTPSPIPEDRKSSGGNACRDCSQPLTGLETAFYGDRCEPCEQAWSDRISAWRRGETTEPELDAFYAGRAALSKATEE